MHINLKAIEFELERKSKLINQLQAELARTQKEGKWVSVHDRLPEPDVSVLVCNEADQIFTCRVPVIQHNLNLENTDTVRHCRFTHWQYLPDLPKI
ncbi:coil containing protein [Vibrio phage 1.169.O._10N.261.52.B1]|uniref:Coil containing protein n=1 Tax=Vibrio phage 1.169.O._10N.261.52.B1 TaxID=1881213 RepID=A0A2I7REH3_9CAUD|nr:coil containing protein [Vibrio phage 1.169.O._10N.261.52.B1]AUR92058.1 coil containing protein [Vibrio phage 1.169.O._10N.261.52.B1]